MGKPNRITPSLFYVSILLFAAGCRTSRPMTPVDLSRPGWSVMAGQAVWKPGERRAELAGELLVARHVDGRQVIQFEKTPFTMVMAQLSSNRWAVEFPGAQRRFSGGGDPPPRFLWLYLPAALQGQRLPGGVAFQMQANGGWRLENKATREWLEGYLNAR